MHDFNRQIISEFRTNGGKVGGPFSGGSLLLLTTRGAKSGQSRVSPLVYVRDGERLVIVASKGGAPTNPDWYHNLLANPTTIVEVGSERFEAQALVVSDPQERDRLYAKMVAKMPGFADYQKKTTRKIPVITLERIG